MDNPASQRNPWEDVSMAGAEEEEEQEADLLEDVSGIMVSGYSCHCSQQWGFPSPHPMVFLPRICPHHIQLFRHGLFSPNVICPRLLSLLMCLTIFTWIPWNARQPD